MTPQALGKARTLTTAMQARKAGFIYEKPGRYPDSRPVHLSKLEALRKIK